jgi:DNA-binding winged helix-turn-helix (wHTH) protein
MNRPARISLGDLSVDLDQRRLFLKDSPIAVRQRAIDVLIALVEAEGRIVSRDQLMAAV